jgi:hypothetical protein
MAFVKTQTGRWILPAFATVLLLAGPRGAAAQTNPADSDGTTRVGVTLSRDLFKAEPPAPVPKLRHATPLELRTVAPLNLRDIAPQLDDSRPGRETVRAGARGTMTPPRRERSLTRQILGGAAGGVGGFFGGGFLGAKIEGDRCDCDDPGLMGFLIGAPIGALVGAILGVKFL